MEGKDFGYYDARMGSAIHRTTGFGHGKEGYLGLHIGFILKASGRTSGRHFYGHSDGVAHPLHYESGVPINF